MFSGDGLADSPVWNRSITTIFGCALIRYSARKPGPLGLGGSAAPSIELPLHCSQYYRVAGAVGNNCGPERVRSGPTDLTPSCGITPSRTDHSLSPTWATAVPPCACRVR